MLRIRNKSKFIKRILMVIVSFALIILLLWAIISGIISLFNKEDEKTTQEAQTNTLEEAIGDNEITNGATQVSSNAGVNSEVLNEWNLKLVNKDNSVDSSYVPELEEIDDGNV